MTDVRDIIAMALQAAEADALASGAIPGYDMWSDAVLSALHTAGWQLVGQQRYVIRYEHRSDDGPTFVGPFPSGHSAQAYADSLCGPGWQAVYSICPITAPEA